MIMLWFCTCKLQSDSKYKYKYKNTNTNKNRINTNTNQNTKSTNTNIDLSDGALGCTCAQVLKYPVVELKSIVAFLSVDSRKVFDNFNFVFESSGSPNEGVAWLEIALVIPILFGHWASIQYFLMFLKLYF